MAKGRKAEGRKGEHAASVTWKVAIQLLGSEERLTAGIKERTWKWWQSEDQVPAHRIVRVLTANLPAEGPPAFLFREPSSASERAEPRHLARWYRNARTFTAMVEMLQQIEGEAKKDPEAGKRWQAAWRILISVRPVLEQLAGWTDGHWLTLERSRKDHWERITKRREQQVISDATQEELPL